MPTVCGFLDCEDDKLVMYIPLLAVVSHLRDGVNPGFLAVHPSILFSSRGSHCISLSWCHPFLSLRATQTVLVFMTLAAPEVTNQVYCRIHSAEI